MVLEILDALQQICGGRKIHELFDYVVGVSTGALIAALIAGLRMDVGQCKQIYREVSVKLFDQGRFAGSLGLIRSHSYYNTEQWVNILKQTFGDLTLMEMACNDDYLFGNEKHKERLKLGIVSCVAQPRFEPFIFRNYYYHPDNQSNYLGSGAYKLWEALRASAAAPGYFEECK
uniref:PNPLA domain-containing protein n=1 Tax=Romanomermis culicivorax TaxID=13658 RepID=A0A915I2T1_ROMCU